MENAIEIELILPDLIAYSSRIHDRRGKVV